MFNRRPFPAAAGLAAVAALLTACGMPQAMDPPPPPMEAPPPPELYGGADPMAAQYSQGPCAIDPYPAAMPPPPCDPAMMPPPADEEAQRALAEAEQDAQARAALPPPQRPGWGTMAPIPNPDEGARAYAERGPVQPYGEPETQPYAPRGYVEVTPGRPGEAPYADSQGVPAAYNRSIVVTMEPIPNPTGTTRAGVDDDGAAAAPPRRERVRRRSDEGLLGAPTERRAQAAPARRQARTAAAASAPAPQRAEPARATERAAAAPARKPAAQAAKPLPRRGMEHFRNVLSQLVQRDSTLSAPNEIVPGRTETVTLVLPATLADTMAREAKVSGIRDGAAGARISARLVGDGWTFEPDAPQNAAVRAGRTSTFTWRATPEAGADRLRADVDALLPRAGGRTETLNLAQLSGPELAGGGEAAGRRGGGAARLIAAIVLLLVLGGAFWLLRRRDDTPATVGSARRRRYREPVNLTPYAPNADTPAPGPSSTT